MSSSQRSSATAPLVVATELQVIQEAALAAGADVETLEGVTSRLLSELQVVASYEAISGSVDVASIAYALLLAVLLMLTSLRPELKIGLWFGWQAFVVLLLVLPYPMLGRAAVYARELLRAGDSDAAHTRFCFFPAAISGAVTRVVLQILGALLCLVTGVTFLGLRLRALAHDCDAVCQENRSAHILALVCAAFLVLLAISQVCLAGRVAHWLRHRAALMPPIRIAVSTQQKLVPPVGYPSPAFLLPSGTVVVQRNKPQSPL